MAGRSALPFVTLVAGFALGALTMWALQDDATTTLPSSAAVPTEPAGRDAPRDAQGDALRDDGPQHPAPATSRAKRAAPTDATKPGPAAARDGAAKGVTGAPAGGAPPHGAEGRAPGDAAGQGGNAAERPPRGQGPAVTGGTPAVGVTAGTSSGAATPVVREAPGVVVDAATQLPIAGARVLLAVADGPRAGSWWGDTTDAEGRFHPKIGDDRDLQGAHLELRVSRDGYEISRTPASAEPVRIELRARVALPMPARVLGTARDEGGRPAAGEIEVDGYDEIGGNASQRTVADAQGAFVLEGVPPGRWHFSRGHGQAVGADVPDGGETRIDLPPPRAAGQGGFAVTDVNPAAVKPADPARAERHAVLLRLLTSLGPDAAPALDDAARERLRLAVAREIQQLDADDRATLPRRVVTVTGLGARISGGSRAWVRLEVKPRLFWRVEAQSGAARFPAVPIGTYTAVLVQPGRADQACTVIVPPGDAALAVEWGR